MSRATEVEGAVDLGPKTVLGVVTTRLGGRTSGAEVEQRLWFLMTISDGKIKRTAVYTDPIEAVRASGLLD